MGPEQSIEGFLKAVEIHRPAGQESLQEVDPALLEVLRDGGFGLGWEPVVVHASRLSPDARTDIRAGPRPAPARTCVINAAMTREQTPIGGWPELTDMGAVNDSHTGE